MAEFKALSVKDICTADLGVDVTFYFLLLLYIFFFFLFIIILSSGYYYLLTTIKHTNNILYAPPVGHTPDFFFF